MQCVPTSYIQTILTQNQAFIFRDFIKKAFVLIWVENGEIHQLIIDTTQNEVKEREDYWMTLYENSKKKSTPSHSDEMPEEVRSMILKVLAGNKD